MDVNTAVKSITWIQETNQFQVTFKDAKVISRDSQNKTITLEIPPQFIRLYANRQQQQNQGSDSAIVPPTDAQEFDGLLNEIDEEEKDAFADREQGTNGNGHENNNHRNNKNKNNVMKILLWSEREPYYGPGCLGHQALSYCISDADIIVIDDRYKRLDRTWFQYNIAGLLGINEATQIIWYRYREVESSVHNEFGTTNRAQMEDVSFMRRLVDEIILPKIFTEHYSRIIMQPRVISQDWMNLYNHVIQKATATATASTTASVLVSGNKKNAQAEAEPRLFQSESEARSVIHNNAMDYDQYKKFGNKACLHRYVGDLRTPSLFEQKEVYSSVVGLTESVGFSCRSKAEMLVAYDLVVQETGHPHVLLKDAYGAGGEDIFFMSSKEEIQAKFEYPSVDDVWLVNEDLNYKHNGKKIVSDNENENSSGNSDSDNKVEFVGVTFDGGRILCTPMEQLLEHKTQFVGSITYYDRELQPILTAMTKQVIDRLGITKYGGFDYAIQKYTENDAAVVKYYLIDMNVGRNTANHQSFNIVERFQLTDKICMRKNLKIESKSTAFKQVLDYHESHQQSLLLNLETKRGVYTHAFVAEAGVSVLSVFGDTHEQCWQLYHLYAKVVNQAQLKSRVVDAKEEHNSH